MDHATLHSIEMLGLRGAFAALVISAVLYGATYYFRASKALPRAGAAFAILSLVALVTILFARAFQADEVRIPLTSLFEFSVCFVMGIVLAFLVASLKWNLRPLAPPILVVAIAVYWLGLRGYQEVEPTIVAALHSYWRNIHILTAMLSYGPLAVAFVTGLMALRQYRVEAAGKAPVPVSDGEEPPLTADQLDEITYRIIAFSFPWLTALIITGAIWAESAWGTWWAWDPKEVWSMITWIIYAAYLHSRLVRKWKGATSSAVAVAGFALVLFTWIGVNWIAKALNVESIHAYDK